MKPRFQPTLFLTALFLGAITCLAGCATTGMERATKTTTSMDTVEGDYRQVSAQIDATRASLENLIKPDQTDMKVAFDAYSENVKKMEKLGKQLDAHTEQMSTRGDKYFAEWERSYTNPDIRELSERRQIEMREAYAKIPEASIGVSGSLKAYLADIRDIQKYLSNDLTPQGVDAIKPIVQMSANDGDSVKEAVRPVLAAIDRVKYEMAQGGMNRGSAAGGEQKELKEQKEHDELKEQDELK